MLFVFRGGSFAIFERWQWLLFTAFADFVFKAWRGYTSITWRVDRAAEGDGLENRCVSNGTKGSNPLLSATAPTFP